jgi:hypothetical protein
VWRSVEKSQGRRILTGAILASPGQSLTLNANNGVGRRR